MEGLSYYIVPSESELSWSHTYWSSELLLGYLSHRTPLFGFLCVAVAKTTLFRSLLHINATRVLVVEYLTWRQQFFLELLYRHVPVCLLAILIFFLGVFWKIVFAGKSLFFYLGFGLPRTELSSTRFPELPWSPLSSSYVIMGLRPSTKGGCILLGSMTPQH